MTLWKNVANSCIISNKKTNIPILSIHHIVKLINIMHVTNFLFNYKTFDAFDMENFDIKFFTFTRTYHNKNIYMKSLSDNNY